MPTSITGMAARPNVKFSKPELRFSTSIEGWSDDRLPAPADHAYNVVELYAMAAEDWTDRTIVAENCLGADLAWVADASHEQRDAFALWCVGTCRAWADKVGARPRVKVVSDCVAGSLEAILWAAGSIELDLNARFGFPEYLAVDASGAAVSWPFCCGYALLDAWSDRPAPQPDDLANLWVRPQNMPDPPSDDEALLWARSIGDAVNLPVLARTQRMALRRGHTG